MSTAKAFARSACAIANSLDIVGDKWSLLVVRDLLHGKRTYGELADSPERIPTNILAERLKRLEHAGIITSTPYQQRPTTVKSWCTPPSGVPSGFFTKRTSRTGPYWLIKDGT